MRVHAVWCGCLVLGLVSGVSCTGEADDPWGGGGTAADGADGVDSSAGTEGLAAPLDNGPSSGLILTSACAPNDGPAWSLRVGLGSQCDGEGPGPTTPFVGIVVYHPGFLSDPVGTLVDWQAGTEGSARFYPYGSSGPSSTARSGQLYLSGWEGADAPDPPAGGQVRGWYTLVLEDETEIGAAFEGTFCGGDPECG